MHETSMWGKCDKEATSSNEQQLASTLRPDRVPAQAQQPLQEEHDSEEEDHTNQSAATSATTTTSSSITASSSLDTKSLIQSAAKSILDHHPPSPGRCVSDNDDEEDDTHDVAIEADDSFFFPSMTANNNLQSLQTKTLPALPDEQDRKRFVGCLAAVLASSYDWDCQRWEKDDMDSQEALLYVDMSEHDDDDEEVYADSAMANRLSKEEQQQQRAHFHSASDSFEISETNPSRHGEQQQQRKQTTKIHITRGRIRKRRYDVLSELLLESADYLRIEKSQAKAFLPMLSKLLVPKEDASSNNSTADRRPPLWRQGPAGTKKVGSPVRSEIYRQSRDSHRHRADDMISRHVDDIEHLRPFLESLTPGAGFRCLSMFLIQHLLHSDKGYDARVRHAVKTLGVILLVNDMEKDPVDVFYSATGATGSDEYSPMRTRSSASSSSSSSTGRRRSRKSRRSRDELIALATRKFESLEHWVARKLLLLSQQQQSRRVVGNKTKNDRRRSNNDPQTEAVASTAGISRQDLMRGLKIGGTAVVAGTLFAVTGGLAAPAIAASVAAITGGTAVTAAAAAVLTSTAAVTAIFGVGGGSLAAYKMQRRTQGLTEFSFNKESGKHSKEDEHLRVEAELFSTVCLSGWLRDSRDFQRPWGVLPSSPRITDRVELLERYYSVYKPSHVSRSAKILEHWKGEERQLWRLLEQKYGRTPDTLYPFADGPRYRGALTLEQKEVIDQLFVELGGEQPPQSASASSTPFERMRKGWKKQLAPESARTEACGNTKPAAAVYSPSLLDSSFESMHIEEFATRTTASADVSSLASSGFESIGTNASHSRETKEDNQGDPDLPDHVATVWDYEANYGGELYTVKWESELILELCDSVADLAFELVSGGTAQLLKHTALSTLLSAFAWPYALVNAANMIDGTWTLAVERADEAGKELARSLFFSSAGHRPVTLVGFSFGARTIYSCLKEIARYQELWENEQERIRDAKDRPRYSRYSGDSTLANMREPASIVEDAILMGLPNHLSLSSWKACRQAVSGRLVNCYSQKDLILSLMFQIKKFGGLKPVCGVCAVNVAGVENIDVTDLVSGHRDYCLNTGEILKRVRLGQPFSAPQQPRASETKKVSDSFSKLDI